MADGLWIGIRCAVFSTTDRAVKNATSPPKTRKRPDVGNSLFYPYTRSFSFVICHRFSCKNYILLIGLYETHVRTCIASSKTYHMQRRRTYLCTVYSDHFRTRRFSIVCAKIVASGAVAWMNSTEFQLKDSCVVRSLEKLRRKSIYRFSASIFCNDEAHLRVWDRRSSINFLETIKEYHQWNNGGGPFVPGNGVLTVYDGMIQDEGCVCVIGMQTVIFFCCYSTRAPSDVVRRRCSFFYFAEVRIAIPATRT